MTMKSVFRLIGILVLFIGCKSTNEIISDKYKTFKNENYSFNYPKEWMSFNTHGHEYFSPKYVKYKRYGYRNLICLFGVFKKKKEYGSSLEDYVKEVIRYEIEKGLVDNFNIDKINIKGKSVVRVIIYNKQTKFIKGGKIVLNHYYEEEDFIYRIHYSAMTDIYQKYLRDVMIMVNSFKIYENN